MPPAAGWREPGGIRACFGSAAGPTRSCERSCRGPWGSPVDATEAAPPMSRQRDFGRIPRAGLFTEDHEDLRGAVRSFVERELRPHAEAWEEAGDFPVREVMRRAGSMGLFGAKYEPDYGGTGPDLVADAVITEEFARCDSGGVAAALGAHKDLGPYYVYRFGTEERRQRWLVPAISGERIGALAVTEPGAGSDVGGITTKAVPDGEDWVLDGAKTFITN